MKLLAIDTSTEALSLAVWVDGYLMDRTVQAGITHSQQILPLLSALLAEAELPLDALDAVAFGAGPGSFTGLRIACGVAQGLAFGIQRPVVGVGTLLAMAEASGRSRVIACLDARMAEVYHAAYEKEAGDWREVCAPSLSKPEVVPTLEGGEWSAVGSGWAVFPEQLSARYSGQIVEQMPSIGPHARTIATLAVPLVAQGLTVPAHLATPVYVRNKVALKTHERS